MINPATRHNPGSPANGWHLHFLVNNFTSRDQKLPSHGEEEAKMRDRSRMREIFCQLQVFSRRWILVVQILIPYPS